MRFFFFFWVALTIAARCFAAPTTRPEMVLQIGHSFGIAHAALSPSGQTLATAGEDGTTCLWDVRTGDLRRTLPTGYVRQVAWSRDGKTLFTASNELQCWDTRSGVRMRRVALPGGWYLCEFSPDARLLAVLQYDSRESRIGLWDTTTGSSLRLLPAMEVESYPTAIAWSRDGAFVAAINRKGKAIIWRARDGSEARTVDFRSAARRERSTKEGGDDYYVRAMAFSFDGNFLAAGGDDGIRLADWKARRVTRKLATREEYEETRALRFSRDGTKLFAATMNDERVWNVSSGKFMRKIGSDVAGFFNDAPGAGTFLIGGGNAAVALWSDSKPAPLQRFPRTRAGGPNLQNVRLSRDGRWMQLSTWHEGNALWDWQNLRSRPLTTSGEWISGTPSLIVSAKKNTLEWRSMPDGALHKRVTLANPPRKNFYDYGLSVLAISPDARLAAVLSNSQLLLLDARTGAIRRRVPRPKGEILRAVWSPDGTLLAMGGGEEHGAGDERGTFSIFDLKRYVVKTFAAHIGVHSFAWSPRGEMLAVGCGNEEGNDSWGEIQLWDARAGRLQRYLLGHNHAVTSLAWSGDTLLSASRADTKGWHLPHSVLAANNTISPIWSTSQGTGNSFEPLGSVNFLRYEQGARISICRIRDGKTVATLVPLPSGRTASLFKNWLLYTPDGFYTGSPGCERWIRWRVGEKLLPAEKFQSQFNRIDKVRAALRAPA